MTKIVDVASKFYKLRQNSENSYAIDEKELDSVILFEDTDTYCRFSSGETGNVYYFLKNIVGLSHNEIMAEGIDNITAKPSLLSALKRAVKKDEHKSTEYSFEEIVGEVGYNDYIASRNVNEETAFYYGLEISGPDVIIPLYDDNFRRIGSIKRFAFAEDKNDRYRTYMLGNNAKPCCWDMLSLRDIKKDTTIILVEGSWSVCRIHQVIKPLYPHIIPVATLGTKLDDALLDYIHECKIVSILDDDTGGNKVKSQLRQWTKRINRPIHAIDLKLGSDNVYVDDLSDAKLIKLFKELDKQGKL